MTTMTHEQPHMVIGNHKPPRRLHYMDCTHPGSSRADYDPHWREATAEELATLKTCVDCGRRAPKL